MSEKFDILEYLSGLTGFVFDKAVLKRIALDRGVADVSGYDGLTTETKQLLMADVLYAAYLSPNVWASQTNTHDNFSKSIGSQTI